MTTTTYCAVTAEAQLAESQRVLDAHVISRLEVVQVHARLSHAGDSLASEPLFCGAAAPHGDRCAKVHGHGGFHHGATFGALAWGDGDGAAR